jgi:Pyruvate/2-oxoacid:ferredoxin oxidoreductase delta subunit
MVICNGWKATYMKGGEMDSTDQVYVRLQKHLDNQPVGLPATRSGVEIKILKHIFMPSEAEIATCLSYKPEQIDKVFGRAGHLVRSKEELVKALDCILLKGGIGIELKGGEKQFFNIPLIVGMFEMQLGRLTPEFIKDFNKYTSDKKFGIEFLSTELPQMRTIPVAKSIHPHHHISTFDEATTLLKQSEGPFVILECICRKKKKIEGKTCMVTDRKETCLAIGSIAQSVLGAGVGREIASDEAMLIIEQNQKDGLVLQPSNTEKADFICSCCGCCCGMLSIHKFLPKPLDFWASNFYAEVDINTCSGCAVCETKCQVGAVQIPTNKQIAFVDLNRCIGCGICVSTCPNQAMSLLNKPVETRPPQTREDLYDIIMLKKKGRLGKLKLQGKLVMDTISTRQTMLSKQ